MLARHRRWRFYRLVDGQSAWHGAIFMLLMLVLGMGAGLMNSVRTVAEMRRKQDALDAARHSAQTAQDEE